MCSCQLTFGHEVFLWCKGNPGLLLDSNVAVPLLSVVPRRWLEKMRRLYPAKTYRYVENEVVFVERRPKEVSNFLFI